MLTTSTGARRQPLTVVTTTAGYDRNSICWELWDYALKVRDGIVTDDAFLPVIFAADPEDDWKSPDTWHKAHPGLGVEAAEVSVMDYLNLDTLPEAPPVTAAMLMLIGALYENRESVTDKPVSESVLFTRLLAPYRKLAL